MGRYMFLANIPEDYDFTGVEDYLYTEFFRIIKNNITNVAFIDTAYNGSDLQGYQAKVKSIFRHGTHKYNVTFLSKEGAGDPIGFVQDAKALAVGGGDLNKLRGLDSTLQGKIFERVEAGIPYVAWNTGGEFASPSFVGAAGSDILCLNIVPFQFDFHFNTMQENDIKQFLIDRKKPPKVKNSVCMLRKSIGGSGIRLEDQKAGVSTSGPTIGPPYDNTIKIYQLDSNDDLIEIPVNNSNADDLPIMN